MFNLLVKARDPRTLTWNTFVAFIGFYVLNIKLHSHLWFFFRVKKEKHRCWFLCYNSAVVKRNTNECPVNVGWKYCFTCQKKAEKGHYWHRWYIKNCCEQHHWIQKSRWTWPGLEWYHRNSRWKWEPNKLIKFVRILEEKSSMFPQNLWIKVQQTKARAASKKTWWRRTTKLIHLVHTFLNQKKDFGTYFCAKCNQTNFPENPHARGPSMSPSKMWTLNKTIMQLEVGGRWHWKSVIKHS